MLVRYYTLRLRIYLQNSVARARAEGSSEILNVFKKKRFITVNSIQSVIRASCYNDNNIITPNTKKWQDYLNLICFAAVCSTNCTLSGEPILATSYKLRFVLRPQYGVGPHCLFGLLCRLRPRVALGTPYLFPASGKMHLLVYREIAFSISSDVHFLFLVLLSDISVERNHIMGVSIHSTKHKHLLLHTYIKNI